MEFNLNKHYFAGFFDGEGCVQIGKNGSLQLRIVNTNLIILENIKESYGGSVNKRSQIVNKPQYLWSIYGEDALKIASILKEICIEKSKQLEIAIEWCSIRDNYSGIRLPNKRGKFSHPERKIKIKEYQEKISKLMKGINE